MAYLPFAVIIYHRKEVKYHHYGVEMGAIPMLSTFEPQPVAFCPVMDRRQFALVTGLTEDTVLGMIAKGYLPCIRIGKRSLINIALLQQRCIEADHK